MNSFSSSLPLNGLFRKPPSSPPTPTSYSALYQDSNSSTSVCVHCSINLSVYFTSLFFSFSVSNKPRYSRLEFFIATAHSYSSSVMISTCCVVSCESFKCVSVRLLCVSGEDIGGRLCATSSFRAVAASRRFLHSLIESARFLHAIFSSFFASLFSKSAKAVADPSPFFLYSTNAVSRSGGGFPFLSCPCFALPRTGDTLLGETENDAEGDSVLNSRESRSDASASMSRGGRESAGAIPVMLLNSSSPKFPFRVPTSETFRFGDDALEKTLPSRRTSSVSYSLIARDATRRTASSADRAASGVERNASRGSHDSEAASRRMKSMASSLTWLFCVSSRDVSHSTRDDGIVALCSRRVNAASSFSSRTAFAAGSSTKLTLGSEITRIMRCANLQVPVVSST
mmetsp:Transcript_9212/g.30666  ORF Transcript_9212/g.30666 Transcript_9212/m.30666 type:complete len:399 (-) Transcript_9212:1044-2240(-)